MALFEFTPNSAAVILFKAQAGAVTGEHLMNLMAKVFGQEILSKHIIAQDPIRGSLQVGKEGIVKAIVNPDETDHRNYAYTPVGTLKVLSL